MIQLQGHNNQIMAGVAVGTCGGRVAGDRAAHLRVFGLSSVDVSTSSSSSPSSSYHHYHCLDQHNHQTSYRAEVLACWILVRWTHRAAMHFTHT